MKLLPLYTLLLGFLIAFFMFKNPKKADQEIQIFKKIDTILLNRETYIHDTVEIKKKIVLNHYDTIVKSVDSVFSQERDSLKIVMFNSYYKPYDTVKLMEITNGQAKSAIEVKNLWEKDSSLLNICEDNIKNCDGSLQKIKVQIDTLKNIKPVLENHFFRDAGFGSLFTGLVFLGTYIFLTR